MANEDELNPLTLGDMPEDYIENDDGSVVVLSAEEDSTPELEFSLNLATVFDESDLTALGSELIEQIKRDTESRAQRDKQYEEGLRRSGLGDDAPGGAEFSGSSRVVHPVLAEGCVDFAARAIKELFPAAGPVKSFVAGEVNPQKLERATRKTRFMNWQLTTQIVEYRSELEQLLTQLPMGGSQYLKLWPDFKLRRPRTEFVPIDDLILPFAASSFYTSPRVTHRQYITKYELEERVTEGLYRDVFVGSAHSILDDRSATSVANDKIEGREEDGYNDDGLRVVYEVQVSRKFKDDELTEGEAAPYIITIDEDSEKVLSIYRNWEEDDERKKKLEWIVEWKYIPWRGAYAIGLPHLIGGISGALTGALRALLDSAHINNAATMLKLKGTRTVGQNTQVNVTQVCDIEGPAGIDDIRKLAMPMPFNPPSAVLAGLMDKLYDLARGVVSTTEDQVGQVGDRTPVGTTQALIETGSVVYSAIHARLHESQKKALEILHRIDAGMLDEEDVVRELGEQVVTREDFTGSMDVIPVSDPTIFSEAQRFAQVQALVQMSQDQRVQWNVENVYRRALRQMRVEAIDDLLPPERSPFTGTIVQEHKQWSQGFPLKAHEAQDHQAHILGHLAYAASPLQAGNPLVPAPAVQQLIAHIEEHIQLLQTVLTEGMLQQVQMEAAVMGQQLSEEQVQAQAVQKAEQQLAQQLAPVLQQVGQIQQQLTQRTPPAPMPPEVQASIQIAQMDIQRKTAYDQGMLQIKQQESAASSQLETQKIQTDAAAEQARLQMDQMRFSFETQLDQTKHQFQLQLEQERNQLEQWKNTLRAEIDVLNNTRDNEQKQETELLKNTDDNDTKLIIEQMRIAAAPTPVATPADKA